MRGWRPGRRLEAARAELRTRYAAILAAHPEVYKADDHYQISVTRMHEQINARANTILWVLFAASGLLFVIACSNVANLVLARTVRRESELAVRAALGATAPALRRSLLAESMVLCGTGVLAALLLAWPMVAVLGRYAARFSVRADGLTLDSTLVWFGIALALVASVFLAYIPRLPAADTSRGLGLNSGGTRVTAGKQPAAARFLPLRRSRHRSCCWPGPGVLMKTLFTLEQKRPPFDTARVLAVNLPVMSYGRTEQQVRDFYREVQRRVRRAAGSGTRVDGVQRAVARRTGAEHQLLRSRRRARRGRTGRRICGRSCAVVSPGFFGTLGVPIVEGRDFQGYGQGRRGPCGDREPERGEASCFPGRKRSGASLRWTDPVMKFIGISYEPRRIVGVVPDFDDENIIPNPHDDGVISRPTRRDGTGGCSCAREQADPYALVPAITRTIHEMAADQPVERASTLEDIRAEVLTPDKLNAIVFGGFAAVALLISVVGVAGVLAFSVSGRTKEFGIRMALGAQPREHPDRCAVRRADDRGDWRGGWAGAGLRAHAGCAGQYVAAMHQPGALSFVASAVVILAAAVIASAVPAARAARVNAVEALRAE